jgi:glycosyltransferase involved in cell wall biosynthesis
MKVTIVAPFDLRLRDGTSIRVTNLTKASADAFENVFILSQAINEELRGISNLKYIELKELQARYHLFLAFLEILSKQFAYSIASKILENSFFKALREAPVDVDIVHVHWLLHKYLARILTDYIKNSDVPIIVDLHGLYKLQPMPKYDTKSVLMHALGLIHEFLTIRDRYIKAFTVPSRGLKAFLAKTFKIDPSKIFVVPDAVDLDTIEYAKKCDAIEEEMEKFLAISQNLDNVVAYAGTLSVFHGFFDLIRAVEVAKKIKGKNIRLMLIVPSKNQASKFLNILPEDTIILDKVPRKFVPCILRKASVLVLPHKVGTQFDYIPSNKIYDYMLAGRPIVAYGIPAVTETLETYPMKIFINTNNVHALARGIIQAMDLWANAEPKPIFYDVPTLEEVEKELILTYKWVLHHES